MLWFCKPLLLSLPIGQFYMLDICFERILHTLLFPNKLVKTSTESAVGDGVGALAVLTA